MARLWADHAAADSRVVAFLTTLADMINAALPTFALLAIGFHNYERRAAHQYQGVQRAGSPWGCELQLQ
jgi:hypothetical protein